jgi:hypothetical protein
MSVIHLVENCCLSNLYSKSFDINEHRGRIHTAVKIKGQAVF